MPAADWLSDEFLASVKRRANVPTSSDGWNAADILRMATDEMRDSIVPMLRRLNEEFLIDVYDVAVVSGTAAYRIPEWALGESLRDVQLSDGQGGFYSLARREPHDVSGVIDGVQGQFYVEDDSVVLVPTPSSAQTLRLKCVRRPSKLIETDEAFALAAATGTSVSVTLLDSSGDTAQATLGASATVDVIRAKPGFRILGSEIPVTISGNTITFASSVATLAVGCAVGDYVCLTGKSPVPQIPAELHGLLAQSVACAYLRAGSQPGLEAAEAKRGDLLAGATGLFTPRTQNQPRHIVNKLGTGWGNWLLRRRM